MQDYFSIFIDNTNVHNALNSNAKPFYDVEVKAGLGQTSAEVIYRCLTWETLPGPCDPLGRRVIGRNGHNLDSILVEGSEFVEGNDSNAWIAEKRQTGDAAMIKIDLGCQKELNGFYVRNFHSGNKWEDGTKKFKITLCDSTASSLNPGSTGCKDRFFYLGKISNRWVEKTFFIPLETAVSVRLVAIRIQSFFGQRGGLHYFRENEEPDLGSSYQGIKNKY